MGEHDSPSPPPPPPPVCTTRGVHYLPTHVLKPVRPATEEAEGSVDRAAAEVERVQAPQLEKVVEVPERR